MRNSSASIPAFAWAILAVSTFALLVSNGLSISGLPPFYKPIREEFVAAGIVNTSVAETFIANGANITFLMSGLFSLIGGWLVTRFRLRPMMMLGCVMLGGGTILLSISDTIPIFYLSRFLMGASLGFIGVAPCIVLVSRWFSARRGLALGILLTGTSLGGAVVPLLAQPLIAEYGWRTALVILSLLVWAVLLPLVVFLVRETAPVGKEATEAAEEVSGATLGQALRTPLFWAIAACGALVFYPIFATTQQFILYLQTPRIGISAETAALAQSLLFTVGIGGRFLAGYLSDRLGTIAVIIFCAGLMFAASLVLLNLTASNAFLFLLPFAVGYGGTFVLLQRLTVDSFGQREPAKILGALTMIEVIGAAIGGRVTGYLADANGGDYTTAFYVVTAVCAAAFISTIVIFLLGKRESPLAAGL
ncbi:MAG: MFS transporter [Acidobacteriota bacterium]|nr:MAG: MFS transporter [Acidobacteriota bacterium]